MDLDRIEISDSIRLRYRELLIEAFKFTTAFLKRNNLHYIACGGSVLGAVRHKGLIPWDDDIDLYMPREDYDKLSKLQDALHKEGYSFVTFDSPGYYLPFAKICNEHTTIWERRDLPYIIGVFIDIFPLDQLDMADDEIERIQIESQLKFYTYVSSIRDSKVSNVCDNLLHLQFNSALHNLRTVVRKKISSQLFRQYKELLEQYTGKSGESCVCLTQWEGKIFKTEWFKDTIEVPFEDTTIIIPRDYDSYLKLLYGDYMTPPPPESRESNHYLYYINLDERKTIEEVRELKRNAH